MTKSKRLYLLLGLLLTASAYATGYSSVKERIDLYAPSKDLLLQVEVTDGKLSYGISYRNSEVLLPSQLLWEVNGKQLGNRVKTITASKPKTVRDSYAFMGNQSQINSVCRTQILDLCEESGEKYQVEIRAYDGGVSFRYLMGMEQQLSQMEQTLSQTEKKISSTGYKSSQVNDFTQYRLPAGATCWLQPNARYYEADYNRYEVGKLPEKVTAGPPVTIKYPSGIYACITEGGLENFGGVGLKVISPDCFQNQLEGETKVEGVNIITPWRVIMVGDLNSLVNNYIVSDVSQPISPVFTNNRDWIRPGNCAWSWLAGYGVTLENMKRFTDWASELGMTYNLVDEGWSHWNDKERGLGAWDMVKELVDYSTKKGVKVLLWKAYPDRAGIEGIQTSERRRAFFKKCKELGIAGLKIDFFDKESQEVTRYYAETLKDAAEYGLIINYHGSNKPTGLSRTYPNELTREGIKGLEFGSSDAGQDVVTPFTRFVAGHADFTPMAFEKDRMGNTTEAHQIAVTAIFLSPLRCYGGRPEDYVNHPARKIFLNIPTVWDETHVLPPSEIGDCVIMSHRNGMEWYISGVTDGAKTDIRLPLSFLGKGEYRAALVTDDLSSPESKACRVSHGVYTKKDALTINMQAGGGFLIRLTPIGKKTKAN